MVTPKRLLPLQLVIQKIPRVSKQSRQVDHGSELDHIFMNLSPAHAICV